MKLSALVLAGAQAKVCHEYLVNEERRIAMYDRVHDELNLKKSYWFNFDVKLDAENAAEPGAIVTIGNPMLNPGNCGHDVVSIYQLADKQAKFLLMTCLNGNGVTFFETEDLEAVMAGKWATVSIGQLEQIDGSFAWTMKVNGLDVTMKNLGLNHDDWINETFNTRPVDFLNNEVTVGGYGGINASASYAKGFIRDFWYSTASPDDYDAECFEDPGQGQVQSGPQEVEWMYPYRTFHISQNAWNNDKPYVGVSHAEFETLFEENAGVAVKVDGGSTYTIWFKSEHWGPDPGKLVDLQAMEFVMKDNPSSARICILLRDEDLEPIDITCNDSTRLPLIWNGVNGDMVELNSLIISKDSSFMDYIYMLNSSSSGVNSPPITAEAWKGVASVQVTIDGGPTTYAGVNLYGADSAIALPITSTPAPTAAPTSANSRKKCNQPIEIVDGAGTEWANSAPFPLEKQFSITFSDVDFASMVTDSNVGFFFSNNNEETPMKEFSQSYFYGDPCSEFYMELGVRHRTIQFGTSNFQPRYEFRLCYCDYGQIRCQERINPDGFDDSVRHSLSVHYEVDYDFTPPHSIGVKLDGEYIHTERKNYYSEIIYDMEFKHNIENFEEMDSKTRAEFAFNDVPGLIGSVTYSTSSKEMPALTEECPFEKEPVIAVPQCQEGEEDDPEVMCYAENKAHIGNVYPDSFDVVIPFSDTEVFGENPDADSIITKFPDWNVNDDKTTITRTVPIDLSEFMLDLDNDQVCQSEEVTIMSASDHVMNGAQVYRENQELKVTFELCFNMRPAAVSSDSQNVVEPQVKLLTERQMNIVPSYELQIVGGQETFKIGDTVEFEIENTEGFQFLYQKATNCIVVPGEGSDDVYIYGEHEDYCQIPFFGFEVIEDDVPVLSKYSYKAFKKIHDGDAMMADESTSDTQFLRCNVKPSLEPIGDVSDVGDCTTAH